MGILKKECPVCGNPLLRSRMTFLEDGSFRYRCNYCHRTTFVFPEEVLKGVRKDFNPSERFKEKDEKKGSGADTSCPTMTVKP